jgi:hypothetical protein
MNRFQKKAELSEVEQIENFIMSCGFIGVSDVSSDNKIFSKNGSVIVIRKNTCSSRGDIWEK